MDDVRAVMDAVGSRRAVLAGFSEGGAMIMTYAASHPERVSHLVLYGAFAIGTKHRDPAFHERVAQLVVGWGNGENMKSNISPDADVSAETLHHFGKIERLEVTPGGLKALLLLNGQIDVRPLLPSIRVPCLVLHRRTDTRVPIEQGRALAAALPDATLVELPDGPHGFWVGDREAILGEIEEFVTGRRLDAESDADRVLATVLFTDIAGSTRNAVEVGDRRWRDKLDEHDRLARQIVERHRGKAVKMTGDGVLATFDGPGRAVRCALAFSEAVRSIGLPVRAGLHTGEIELRGEDVGGITVHAAARVMDECPPGEVLVSRVVTDLVAGAGLQFAERGSRELKGLPGRWELYAASLQRAELSASSI